MAESVGFRSNSLVCPMQDDALGLRRQGIPSPNQGLGSPGVVEAPNIDYGVLVELIADKVRIALRGMPTLPVLASVA